MSERWPLTGRGEQLGLMADALGGNGSRGVLIVGPAGVGKTRLAHEAITAATALGQTSYRVACTAAGRSVPLGAFTFVGDIIDDVRVATADRVIDALTSGVDGQIVLGIDDAHLLDDASADVVERLLRSGAVRAVLTVRAGGPGSAAAVARWSDALLRTLELQPLLRTDFDRLVRRALVGAVNGECAQRLWARTRGNVLFLHHLLHQEQADGRLRVVGGQWQWAETATMSQSLRDLVLLQIGAMSDDVRDVVGAVAVADTISRSILTGVAEPAAVEEASGRGLITAAPSSPDAFVIGHPLYAEAIVARDDAGLARLRGRVAVAIERAGSSVPVDPIRLGLLWLASDLPADPGVLGLAADAAADRLDSVLAERFARAAVGAGGGTTASLRHARALHFLGRGAEAARILDGIPLDDELAEGPSDPLIIRIANLTWGMGALDEATRLVDDALETASGPRRHGLLVNRALQLMLGGRPAAAMSVLGTVERGRLARLDQITALIVETMALADLGQDLAAGVSARECEGLVAASTQQVLHLVILAVARASALAMAGYPGEALAVAERCRNRCAELPGVARTTSEAAYGLVALRRGDLATALKCLDPDVLDFDEYSISSGVAYRYSIYYAEALAVAGDSVSAAAALRRAQESRRSSEAHLDTSLLLAESWVAASHGSGTAARDVARRAADLARDRQQFAQEAYCLHTAAQFGDGSVVTRLMELATVVEGPRCRLAIRHARALADGNAIELDSVSAGFEVMGDPLVAARTASQAAGLHRRAGRRGSALTAGERAIRLARGCGAAAGPIVAEARVTIPFTRREREVALLVARGLSNREIAEALSLSVRTVEGHVRHSCAKADVASRTELALLITRVDVEGVEPGAATV
ncbi:LuxR family transcriptional regulator [Mycobacterium antarcticum]|uniref:helix-turn-helix transcriptional regulator n=1 Tax=unclassified Mycolicibacterium TaxID=2636767 RepID=UPI002387BFAB|nr:MULTISPECIES: LuxR family transcriptional regulator [unclassified Mycolicibacterium]BDX30590.1 LuxR family transcriptional regulator [Mycolicibacterium sp. TUM20985]GLP78570.1 LuxR family transcriptional regulator [Mycolicibacterium sp. TUM20983]GLP79714.1 LuxR family transcriptional regulator [Mycolicibacterium sp. TUM20984]